uniref:Protein N-terminal asparagine amidohydrolase n=1 Tax=Anopheles arabiensis TaxID=7173 RepID=A0A182HVV3_ANOAR
MVLVLNGVIQDERPINTHALFLEHPVYRETATQLLSIPTKTVGAPGLLYVCQREMAAVAPHDRNVNIIGSDDATTCIIVVVRHSGSGAIALAHLDGNGTDEAVSAMVARVQELAFGYPEGRIELQLIGGFSDPQGYAEDLFSNIMRKCDRRNRVLLQLLQLVQNH